MTNSGIACLLALQLILLPLKAQLPATAPPGAEELKIVVVEGEGAINNTRQRAARELHIQINDAANQPVAGAAVSLILPSQGAGGTFANGSGSTTATTDSNGRVTIRGFRPNGIAGKFAIAVAASSQGRTSHADITQFNMLVEKAPREAHRGKIIAILAVVGAAAAGGAAYAGLHKSGSPPPAPAPAPAPGISITPGTGTVGAPQ